MNNSTESELGYIREMFTEVNLNARVEEQKIYLMNHQVPQETFDKIL